MHQIGKMAAQVYGNIRADGGSRLKAGSAAAGVIASPFLAVGVLVGGSYVVDAVQNYEPQHVHDAPTKILRVFDENDGVEGIDYAFTQMHYPCGEIERIDIPRVFYEGKSNEQIVEEFQQREIDPLGNLEEIIVFRDLARDGTALDNKIYR